jgi:hypothetical protein
MSADELSQRVIRAAEATLGEQNYVAPIDMLVGLGWLALPRVDEWRQGRVPNLEDALQVKPEKLSRAMEVFRQWAVDKGLQPSETVYAARTRDRRELQFSTTGDPDRERTYRTHWVSPTLSEAKRQRLTERQSRAPDLVVINPLNDDWVCTECSGSGDLLLMEADGPICMDCADLGHLVFLSRGDAALTRRAKAASSLSAVVVRFSRARKRYERQGLLVEEAALDHAEAQCLADQDARARRQRREQERRANQDVVFMAAFAEAIAGLFPCCPPERAEAIAAHAAARGTGRVGRSKAGQALDPDAVTLAVVAAIRHTDTGYDQLLMSGIPRDEARARIRPDIERTLDRWRAVTVSPTR